MDGQPPVEVAGG